MRLSFVCSTLTVTTSSSWQRHSMDESSLSFYKEETFSEERHVINASLCGDGVDVGSSGPAGGSSGAGLISASIEAAKALSGVRVAPEREERPREPPTPPPPPLPTVSPPASPEEAPTSASVPRLQPGDSSGPHLTPLGLPPPALTRTSVDVPSALRLAKRLFNLEGFKKVDVSHHLSKK